MKKVKHAKKRDYKRRIKACAKSPTIEDMVKAAYAVGAKFSVSLLPKEPERPRLQTPSAQWPGWAGNRSIMAGMDYTDKDVAAVFKENPSSKWIITPFEIIERSKFFAPKPAPTPEDEQSTSNPS